MKVTLEMLPRNYDALLNTVSTASFTYAILKNGIVENLSNDGAERRVVHILCEPFEAKILLGVAKEVWPDAAVEIKNCIH
jgi:hypothetical protein